MAARVFFHAEDLLLSLNICILKTFFFSYKNGHKTQKITTFMVCRSKLKHLPIILAVKLLPKSTAHHVYLNISVPLPLACKSFNCYLFKLSLQKLDVKILLFCSPHFLQFFESYWVFATL